MKQINKCWLFSATLTTALSLFCHNTFAEFIVPLEKDEHTVGLWDFNNPEKIDGRKVYRDLSDNNIDLKQGPGTTELTSTTSARGLYKAVSGFSDSTRGLIGLPDNNTDFPIDSSMTFEAWIKWDDASQLPQNNSTGEQNIAISLIPDANTDENKFAYRLYIKNNQLILSLGNDLKSPSIPAPNAMIAANINPKEKTWYHVAFTLEEKDNSANQYVKTDTVVKLYFTDERVLSPLDQDPKENHSGAWYKSLNTTELSTYTYESSTGTISSFKTEQDIENIVIGHSISLISGLGPDAFLGNIDDVRISNIARENFDSYYSELSTKFKAKGSFKLFHEFRIRNDKQQPTSSIADIKNNYNIHYFPRLDVPGGRALNGEPKIFTRFWDGLDKNKDFPRRENTKNLAKSLKKAAQRDPSTVNYEHQIIPNNPFGYLDIEHLPSNWGYYHPNKKEDPKFFITDEKFLKDSMKKLGAIADWLHDENPNLRFGYYGGITNTDYFYTVLENRNYRPQYNAAVQKRNELYKNLAKHVDVLLPSIYWRYSPHTISHWKKYAEAVYKDNEKLNKPTYAFIWNQRRFDIEKGITETLDGETWREILETVYNLGFDGAIIWHHWQQDWDGDKTDPNNWWYQTIDFMDSIDLLPESTTWPETQPAS